MSTKDENHVPKSAYIRPYQNAFIKLDESLKLSGVLRESIKRRMRRRGIHDEFQETVNQIRADDALDLDQTLNEVSSVAEFADYNPQVEL